MLTWSRAARNAFNVGKRTKHEAWDPSNDNHAYMCGKGGWGHGMEHEQRKRSSCLPPSLLVTQHGVCITHPDTPPCPLAYFIPAYCGTPHRFHRVAGFVL